MKTLYSHPDNFTSIKIERIPCGEGFDYANLHVSNAAGITVSVQIGQVGLIALGLSLATAGQKMLEAA